ncbi:hypothetical protein CVM73_19080 [Bradyrhizobium forestalis]|uniref:Uncharacterized protein n=1 Tax=Bradyrhizobium forestalis TaxID=1419263 RepID=A0A2M8R706_9BRAD|nr:hypothetical protein CVM73_19080 [Bradyrhizobium forestalis]
MFVLGNRRMTFDIEVFDIVRHTADISLGTRPAASSNNERPFVVMLPITFELDRMGPAVVEVQR